MCAVNVVIIIVSIVFIVLFDHYKVQIVKDLQPTTNKLKRYV